LEVAVEVKGLTLQHGYSGGDERLREASCLTVDVVNTRREPFKFIVPHRRGVHVSLCVDRWQVRPVQTCVWVNAHSHLSPYLACFTDRLAVEGLVVSRVPERSGYDGWINLTLNEQDWPVLRRYPNIRILYHIREYRGTSAERWTYTVSVAAAVEEHFEEVASRY
jgi:hypothetical protein